MSQLLTLYTRSPLHVGCGLSADIVDLPFTRERVTQFPVIPARVLVDVLREAGRQHFGPDGEATVRTLFGDEATPGQDAAGGGPAPGYAGRVQILEARLLAFPVRALRGCFAWLTCPAILHRFHRDTGKLADAGIPSVPPGRALVAPRSDLVREDVLFLEEYRLQAEREPADAHRTVAAALRLLSDDSLWQSRLTARLAIVNDEDFQHFVTTCTEIDQRGAADPGIAAPGSGRFLSQENLPSETLLYSVLTLVPVRQESEPGPGNELTSLLGASPILQIGSGAATGHGFCAAKLGPLS